MKAIRKYSRFAAAFIALSLLFEIVFPTAAFALTGGPSQPEVQSFEPVGTSEMVDIFSGDFTYNIPLLDVEGYPINISYNSGISMDQEASWVGLGWNINPGVINRSMRGLPDDFDGDIVKRELNIRDNWTVGITGKIGFELFGKDGKAFKKFLAKGNVSASLGIKYNNYRGIGFEQSANVSLSASRSGMGKMTGGLGLKSGDEGLTISPSLSYSANLEKKEKTDKTLGGNVGCSYNTRAGLTSMSFGLKMNENMEKSLSNFGTSSSLSFGVQTYTPSIGNQMANATYTLNLKLGSDVMGQDITGNVSGYYSSQRVTNSLDEAPAYGYLNLHRGFGQRKVNLDFNREKDGSFTMNTPALPLTNLTYDIYSVAGQGIGGAYRLFRNDLGYVFDSYEANTNGSGSLGLELAPGGYLKGGFDLAVTDVNTYTEKWSNNPAAGRLSFRGQTGDPLYEPAYFRESGEKSVDSDPAFYQKIGENKAVRFSLSRAADDFTADPNFVNEDGNVLNLPSQNYRTHRQKRNQVITYMTRGEMKRFGLDDELRNTYNAPDHHIGQITTLRADGARYIFGIAAYNIRQEETSFNVGTVLGKKQYPRVDAHTGLVEYDSRDNTIANNRGIDHYYSNTVTPPFAHSYLLTAVLSADYVDVDATRGPSPGDMGTYTRFHYTKVAEPYKWRTPYQQFEANYNEGMKSEDLDDQANYVYGEKELWYVDRIESKNYIAVFTLDDRDDGYAVKDRNGGRGNTGMKRLTRISLYSRADYENSSSPVPIKEVHFEYDYSLCENIPNQVNPGQGKLTLRKIYFTYGSSHKAKYNSYNFVYGGLNPDYNQKAQDRWGNYKPNNAITYAASGTDVSPAEYPYTAQDKLLEDGYAAAWNLTEISLPSGGKISVTYESDDYAYVQDKEAMEMFLINNVGDNDQDVQPAPSLKQDLYSGLGNNLYLFFKLKTPLAGTTNLTAYKPELQRRYLKGISDLYFRFLVNVTNENGVLRPQYNNSFQYVSGYAEIEDYGVSPFRVGGSGPYEYGYVKLKAAKRKDNAAIFNCHPVSKAAWNFGQLSMPKHVFRSQDPAASGVEQLIMALLDGQLVRNILEFAIGTNNMFWVQGYGKQFYRHKSWIRLTSPERKKLGGGCRVKKIELSDEWASMVSGQSSFAYGQEYDYTRVDEETGELISSGVASYEPGTGSDENPFKVPVWHGDKEEKILAPDGEHYMEEPFGESFFPSAGVGYSKVTVRNLRHADVNRNASGKTVHEFYTARDFPTITRRTDLKAEPYKNNPVVRLFTFKSKDFMTTSQGFVIELNDMHGKPKKQMVYAEDQVEPLSGVEYVYQSTKLGKNTYQLDNQVNVVHPDGTVSVSNVGLDYDFVADMRSQTSKVISASGEFNLATIPVIGVPFPVPTAFPGYTKEETRFKSATTTKVIKRAGILKETIAYDLGSRIATRNMAYDAETGEVLLTETVNSFNDPIYNFTYPAHWYYDGMGQAYRNVGLKLDNVAFNSSGVANIANSMLYFVPGDELSFNGTEKLWVSNVAEGTVTVINELGAAFTGTGTIKVMRSGRRNLQSLSIGSITSLSNPLPSLQANMLPDILQANSVIYAQDWKTYCDCFTQQNTNTVLSNNPYVTGQKGIWRNSRSYQHMAGRSQSYENNNSNIRKDGTFTSFNPFWKWSGDAWTIDDQNWNWTTTVTQFNPNGQELENKDPLERHTAGLYAYNHTLVVGLGYNLRLRDMAFDAFEDYSFIPCSSDHFSYRPFLSNIDNQRSHTGTRSIRVNAGDNVTITKPTVPCN